MMALGPGRSARFYPSASWPVLTQDGITEAQRPGVLLMVSSCGIAGTSACHPPPTSTPVPGSLGGLEVWGGSNCFAQTRPSSLTICIPGA